jgi:hypothetical protein
MYTVYPLHCINCVEGGVLRVDWQRRTESQKLAGNRIFHVFPLLGTACEWLRSSATRGKWRLGGLILFPPRKRGRM